MRKLPKLIVAVLLAYFSLWRFASAQAVQRLEYEDRVIDLRFLAAKHLPVTCDMTTWVLAQECVKRIVPTLEYMTAFYVAQQATMLTTVIYRDIPALPPGKGTAFMVDKAKGLFLTARHVLVGDIAWSTRLPTAPNGLDSEIERYLRSGKVDVQLSMYEGGPPSSAIVVAVSKDSDLALLQLKRPDSLQLAAYPVLSRAIAVKNADAACDQVAAIGFSVGPTDEFVQSNTDYASANCQQLSLKEYFIGDQKHQFGLHSSSAAFKPGFSGGPILNSRLEFVGVVSGATQNAGVRSYSFFVPGSTVRSFLQPFLP